MQVVCSVFQAVVPKDFQHIVFVIGWILFVKNQLTEGPNAFFVVQVNDVGKKIIRAFRAEAKTGNIVLWKALKVVSNNKVSEIVRASCRERVLSTCRYRWVPKK